MNRPRVVALLRELLAELEGEDAPAAANDTPPPPKKLTDAAIREKAMRALKRAGVYPRDGSK